jgi:hypothetical protein
LNAAVVSLASPTPPLSQYEVIIWSQPRVVIRGELQPATPEKDTATQLSLARAAGFDENEARYKLLDQRAQNARRARYKLIVRDIARLNLSILLRVADAVASCWAGSRQRPGVRIAAGPSDYRLALIPDCGGRILARELATGRANRFPSCSGR